jgi:hypothetical protein
MICLTCRHAADNRLPRDKHCDSEPGPSGQCTCQHRTDRYPPKTEEK